MVNINKLRGRMVEHEVNADKMASLLGINRATFYRKMENAGEAFTIREVSIIAETLKLNLAELNAIFFDSGVA
ncbi:helix-turn-helix domain-containing protein [Selenomonas sputigena]|uniref:helix-turn-helix domain-containing protein n=1 Tax=Selenomonas sputigena TaxID=69823 RepID=UPI0028E575D7|nr:helix-turn-helix domain-containing protein [Selenomonas sputigena]